jgi:hypothetical protein
MRSMRSMLEGLFSVVVYLLACSNFNEETTRFQTLCIEINEYHLVRDETNGSLGGECNVVRSMSVPAAKGTLAWWSPGPASRAWPRFLIQVSQPDFSAFAV